MWNSFLFLAMLQIGGILCRSGGAGYIESDKIQRMQKTMEIVWPHVDWNVKPCINFGHFSCKDNSDTPRDVKCVDNKKDLKIVPLINKRRQKRQFLQVSQKKVDDRLEEKILDIVTNLSMEVEPGVRKMATLFMIMNNKSNDEDCGYGQWLCKLARLSVCHLMDEYSQNKKFFEDLIPRFREVAVEIGTRAFSDRSHIHARMQALKIDLGFANFDLPSKLTELLEGLSPTENYTETIERLSTYSFKYMGRSTRLGEIALLIYKNAYYDSSDNHYLKLGPLYLISPTFRTDFMHSHIFGGVLATFFHELGHSISKSFADQNDFKICVINEVQNMSVTVECPNERVQLSGRQLEEILADKLGLAMAWYMYNKDYKHLDIENFTYKGRNFTREQIFHLSFGLNQCGDNSGVLDSRIATEQQALDHPNPRNRKNLAVKTIPAFFDAFQCENKDVDYTRCAVF